MGLEAPQQPLRLIHLPVPQLILLTVKACGICRTDLPILDGNLPQFKLPWYGPFNRWDGS